METRPIEPTLCSEPGCERSFIPHKWGAIAAHRIGWFTKKDGTAWCPHHTPEWVKTWRRQTKKKAS